MSELSKYKTGDIVHDVFKDGVRVIVTRGPSSWCVYLGLPLSHPLAGFDYDDIPLECHWGLTHSGAGDGKFRPKDYYWYGWDYAHSGDYCLYDSGGTHAGKKWTSEEVFEEAKEAIYDFAKLKTLAEQIHYKAKKSAESVNEG